MKRETKLRTADRARGFSLLEIVIVLGIMGLLLGVVTGLGSKILVIGKIKATTADISNLRTQLIGYQVIANRYPTESQGLSALVEKPTEVPVPRNWQRQRKKMPLDSWDQPYRYTNPGSIDPEEPEIISAGPDRKFGTEDDISSQVE